MSIYEPTRKSKRTVVPKRVDPLALPADPSQCVHVARVWEDSNEPQGVTHTRCLNTASRVAGRHGWLCDEHSGLMDEWYPIPVVRRSRLSLEDEIIDSILKAEARAYFEGEIEVIYHGKASIAFLHTRKESKKS